MNAGDFNAALSAMTSSEMGLLQTSCAAVNSQLTEACEGHELGHICSMVPELRTDTCEEIADTAVGLGIPSGRKDCRPP